MLSPMYIAEIAPAGIGGRLVVNGPGNMREDTITNREVYFRMRIPEARLHGGMIFHKSAGQRTDQILRCLLF